MSATPLRDPMLRWVVTRSAVVGGVVTLASLTARDPMLTVGMALGAALGVANFWALRWLMARMLQRGGAQRGGAGLLLAVKFLALAAILWWLMRSFPIPPMGLLVGLSVVVAVIVVAPLIGPAAERPDDEAPSLRADEMKEKADG